MVPKLARGRSGVSVVAALTLTLTLTLVGQGVARASEPRLDELAAARGIAAGELDIGARVLAPAGSAARGARAERRSLTLHGLPVRGAFETTWQRGYGPARVVAARYPESDAGERPEQASVDVDAARERFAGRLRPDQLRRASGGDGGVGSGIEAELVYLLLLGRPFLAWELTAPLSSQDPPTRERAWISAVDGRLLEVVELIDLDNQAEVFEVNPQHTPKPSLVTLTNLDPDPEPWIEDMVFDADYLNGTRVRVFNCIDEEDGPFAPWRNDGECWPTQRTKADQDGDYFVPLPDVTLIADNRDPTDLYAELSMYYHAEKFFSFMASLGVESFPCERSNMVANFHYLDPAPNYPDLDYGPYDNAYYSGQCDIEKGPTMLFGQGSSTDFAFDGDVVYHELGHGIVEHLTPEGLRSNTLRPEAVLRDARALNEGIADYHTLMITERPELAEYVGFYWPDLGRPWIRNADNDATCPGHMAGQEHNDSAPFTAALWAARRRIGGAKLDPVVIGMLPLLPGDADIETAAAALLEVAAAEREAGVWTDGDVAQLERALASRNLLDCERVIDDPASLDEAKFLYLRANGNLIAPFWPGPMQFRQVVPEGARNLLVSFEVESGRNSAGQPLEHDVAVRILIKRSSVSEDAPMRFEYEVGGLGHHDEDDGDIQLAYEVTGDWDEIYTPTVLGESRRQVLIRDLEPGEVVHVAFANDHRDTAILRELFFATVADEDLDEGSPGAGRDDEPSLDDADGCACATGPRGGNPRGGNPRGGNPRGGNPRGGNPRGGNPLGLGLGLLVLVAVRRRSR